MMTSFIRSLPFLLAATAFYFLFLPDFSFLCGRTPRLRRQLARPSHLTDYFAEFWDKKTAGLQPLYDLRKETAYREACLDYLAGMTGNFAQRCFREIILYA